MIKIIPGALSGTLVPASHDKSIISSLAPASVSDTITEIRYKGLSDEVMCAINALEKMGASVSVSKESLRVFPTSSYPKNLYLNFCESDKALFMLLPFIKKYVSLVKIDHGVLSKKRNEFIAALTDGGCEIESENIPLTVSGIFSKAPLSKINDPDISDGVALCGFGEGSESVKNAIGFFKNREYDTFFADVDPLYLSYFVMASRFIDCNCDMPNVLKPYVNTEKINGNYRHTPKLVPFSADASVLGDYLFPCVLLAMRIVGECKFENYRLISGDHSRMIQMLGDFGIGYKMERSHTFRINSEGVTPTKKIRAWQDERFIITACLASVFSAKDTILDSERGIIRKYPTFFDDFKALGGIYQKL